MNDAFSFYKTTADLVYPLSRDVAKSARGVADVNDVMIRKTIADLQDAGKLLMDTRAREIAANSPAPRTEGKRTNVGDPNPKGQGKGGK